MKEYLDFSLCNLQIEDKVQNLRDELWRTIFAQTDVAIMTMRVELDLLGGGPVTRIKDALRGYLI